MPGQSPLRRHHPRVRPTGMAGWRLIFQLLLLLGMQAGGGVQERAGPGGGRSRRRCGISQARAGRRKHFWRWCRRGRRRRPSDPSSAQVRQSSCPFSPGLAALARSCGHGRAHQVGDDLFPDRLLLCLLLLVHFLLTFLKLQDLSGQQRNARLRIASTAFRLPALPLRLGLSLVCIPPCEEFPHGRGRRA